MIPPIKTGLLSYGMSGKIFHAPFLIAHAGFELVAVVERSDKKAYLDFPDIKSYQTVDELLTDTDIELIVVNTPNDTHFDFASRALKAGKHVLLEKPFTVNSADAKRLFEEAKSQNRLVLPYQNRRFDSDFLSVKKVVESGRLGKIVEVHIRFDRFRDTIGPKQFKETPIPGSGLLYDLGPHLIDQAVSLFGKPVRWNRTLGCYRRDSQVDDYFHMHLEFQEGLNVFLTSSLLVVKPQPAFVLHGSRGSYVKQRSDVQERQLLKGMKPDDALFGLEDAGMEGQLTYLQADESLARESIASEPSTYLNLFQQIYLAIREGEVYPISKEQIIQQLELLER